MQAPPARMYALTATEALALMKNDTVTVEAYARALLDRIEERDDVVKAWTHLGSRSHSPCGDHMEADTTIRQRAGHQASSRS
jgi:Asp-tRNA(Asn)/Glu-tRNA(Gln) amidotransferase A subunit family amidase